MDAGLDRTFLQFSAKKLQQLASRIEDCLGRLAPEQVWNRGGENENAVANLVLHLCGNVRQWVISGIGGAPDVRDRPAEFAARDGERPDELRARLRATVTEALRVIESLPAARLAERIVVQQYEVTVLEAIFTVVEHFAQHTGQIIFATKIFSGQDLGYYAHLNRPKHAEKLP